MKKRLITAVIFIVLLLSPEAGFASDNIGLAPTSLPAKMKKDGELIVVFKSKPSTRMLLSLSRQSPLINIKYGLSNTNTMVVDIGDGNKDQVKATLKQNPDVESVTVNPSFYPFVIPNDTGIAATPVPGQPRIQWNLFNMKFASPEKSAWDATTGSPDTVVAVLDSGVDSSHEDLAGKFSSLVDCTGSTCQTVTSMTADSGDGASSHGTHVSGLVAAATNNSKGIAASGYNTKIMMIKVMDANQDIKFSYIVNALAWATEHGAKVINMSLGQLEENLDLSIISQMQSTVGDAWGKGVLIVASAGNCGSNTNGKESCAILDDDNNILRYAANSKVYPAACTNVLSVAALTIENQLASYSEHNDPGNPIIGNWVSVAAPGGDCKDDGSDAYYCIASTWPEDLYAYSAGTSMAAPQVAGLAALLFAANPHLSNSQVKQIIETTANGSIAPGATNFGAVDALAAVDAVSSGIVASPTPSPSSTPGPTATPTLTLTPTLTPTPTDTPYPTTPVRLPKIPPDPYPSAPYCPVTVITGTSECDESAKQTGDANCDGRIDSKDYLIWRNQYDTMPLVQPVNQNANFSCDEGNNTTYFIDLVDFEIWRKHTNFD